MVVALVPLIDKLDEELSGESNDNRRPHPLFDCNVKEVSGDAIHDIINNQPKLGRWDNIDFIEVRYIE